MLIDTHTHLNFEAFKTDWQEAVRRAQEMGVNKMVVVGTDIKTSEKAIEMAKQNKALYATVGYHPHHVGSFIKLAYARVQLAQITDQLKKLAKDKKLVGIGECGLDYHISIRSSKTEWQKLKNLQKQVFGMQIQLAKEMNLPMVIHNRKADMEVLDTIDHFCKSDCRYPRGVLHCISGTKKYLKQGLKMGFYIGVDGNVTYSQEVQKLAKEVPLNRLVIETDSPYLTPMPLRQTRGKYLRNEPANVKVVANFLAKLKKVEVDKLEKITTKNAQELFNL